MYNKKTEKIFIIICSLCFLVAFVNRLRFGVETSDEAFYVVTGYRMLKGNIPFGDMWEMSAADAYAMWPFLFLKKLFSPLNEGIELYLRLCYLLPSALGALSVYLYAKKSIEKQYAFLLSLVLLFFTPFQIYSFSYNSLGSLFVTISACMILLGLSEKENKYFYLSGISMAIAVLSYPTMLFCCVGFWILIMAFCRSKEDVKNGLMYIAGGATVAIPVLIHLAVAVGIGSVITNLGFILDSDFSPSLSPRRLAECIWIAIKYLFTPFYKSGKAYGFYCLLVAILALIKRTKWISRYLILIYPLVSCVVCVLGETQTIGFIFRLALMGPFAILLAKNRVVMLKKFALEWGMTTMLYFIISFSSTGGVYNAPHGLIFAAIVSVKLIIETMGDEPELRMRPLLACTFLIMTVGLEIFLFYDSFYRDDIEYDNVEKIETGVYKGLYTTTERKQHLLDLQDTMKQAEDKDESLMILYHSCYAYLMVDMVPKIPTTWGCINYDKYGFDNQPMFMDYLAIEDNIPDNILILDVPKEYDFGGQRKKYYEPYYQELNDYIADHYVYSGTYEKGLSGQVIKYKVNRDSFAK